MKKLPIVTPSSKECFRGLIYLALELLVLPPLLELVNTRLAMPLNDSRLNVLYFFINLLAVCCLLGGFLKQSFQKANYKKVVSAAAVGFLLYWGSNLLVTSLLLRLKPDFGNVNDASIAILAEKDFYITALGTVLFVPVAEELLFRGVLFGGLYHRSPIAAYAVSCIIFSLIHVVGYLTQYPWDTLLLCFLQYIPAGLCLGWAYARCGSIFAPIIMHTAINAIGVLLMR